MAESITSDVGFVAWECGSMEDFEVGKILLSSLHTSCQA